MIQARNGAVSQEAASALDALVLDGAADGEAAGAGDVAVFAGAAPSAAAGLLGSLLDGVGVTSDPVLVAATAGFESERPARLSFL